MTYEEQIKYIMDSIDKKLSVDDPTTLAKYARKVPENGTILDIGTCAGGSAFIMAVNSHPSVKVYTIDPTPNPLFYIHRTKLGLDEKVTIFTKKSQEMVWSLPLDLAFDDGLHNYLGVSEDIRIFYPHVKKGGFCMFHDFKLYNNTVGKAILDHEDKVYKRLEVIENIYIGTKI